MLENEQGRTFDIPRAWVPQGARDGTVLTAATSVETATTPVHFKIDAAATAERVEHVRRLREQLPKGPKGDVSL